MKYSMIKNTGYGGSRMQDTVIGLVQMKAEDENINERFEKIICYANQASSQGVDILCFPEMSLYGFLYKQAINNPVLIPSKFTSRLLDIADKKNITIAVGFIEKGHKEKPYITQFVAFPHRKYQYYRKTHLGESEKEHFYSGSDIPVFTHDKAKIAFQLCWETHIPELSTIQSLKGAEIIFMPFASPMTYEKRKEMWGKYLPARAYDNAVYICACNLIGKDYKQGGGILVYNPKGDLIASDQGWKDDLLIVTLKSDVINRIRNQKVSSMKDRFYLRKRRPELYKDIIREI